MKYIFFKEKISRSTYLGIEPEDKSIAVLGNLTSDDWTPAKAQVLIDGVQKTKDLGEEFKWANEDVALVSHADVGVIFWNMMKRRARSLETKEDLVLTFDEFIDFMKEFKKFIEKNS